MTLSDSPLPSPSSSSIDDAQPLVVELNLSRPAYRLGGSAVVGTIRVVLPPQQRQPQSSSWTDNPRTTTPPLSVRDLVQSLSLCVAGQCRLDPRWQKKKKSLSVVEHGSPHGTLWKDFSPPAHTVCFWSTEIVELLQLQERLDGRWDDAKPKPIRLVGRDSHKHKTHTPFRSVDLESQQLAYTFRVDLPWEELPPTLITASCRYYYSVILRLCTKTSGGAYRTTWVQAPVRILTADPDRLRNDHVMAGDNRNTPATRLQVMAHSNGLPCLLTASELHQWDGQLEVNQQGPALFSHIRPRQNARHVQSQRIIDPHTGLPVGILTMLGAALLYPGSRLVLQFDFPSPEYQSSSSGDDPAVVGSGSHAWVPVHQASACLEGEEVVIREDGSRTRARQHLFDIDHIRIDPHCTESVSLNLILPTSAPCSVSTDTVEVIIRCLVDLVVSADTGGYYRTLRLDIPCRVVHAFEPWENHGTVPGDDDDGPLRDIIEELFGDDDGQFSDPTDPRSFDLVGIGPDLKILSLSMAESCGLRPQPGIRNA